MTTQPNIGRLKASYTALISLTFLFSLLQPAPAGAVSLNVVGGQLVGADDVDVGGTLYDVDFIDGTCPALFMGCDEASDFTFTTSEQASDAAQALIDGVFVDGMAGNFRSTPSLTAGCGFSAFCDVIIPTSISSTNSTFDGILLIVHADLGPIILGRIIVGPRQSFDTSNGNKTVFAVFKPAPIPEPGTILLLSSGLLGLAGYRWSHARRQTK